MNEHNVSLILKGRIWIFELTHSSAFLVHMCVEKCIFFSFVLLRVAAQSRLEQNRKKTIFFPTNVRAQLPKNWSVWISWQMKNSEAVQTYCVGLLCIPLQKSVYYIKVVSNKKTVLISQKLRRSPTDRNVNYPCSLHP